MGTMRKLKAGDLVSVYVNLAEGWCEIALNVTEFLHRFSVPVGSSTPGDYLLGVSGPNKPASNPPHHPSSPPQPSPPRLAS